MVSRGKLMGSEKEGNTGGAGSRSMPFNNIMSLIPQADIQSSFLIFFFFVFFFHCHFPLKDKIHH